MIIFTRLRSNSKTIYYYFEGYMKNNTYKVRLVVEDGDDYYYAIKETRDA